MDFVAGIEKDVEVPPRSARLKYQLLNVPPDMHYRSWVLRDIASPWWAVRSMLQTVAGYLIGMTAMAAWLGSSISGFVVGSIIGLLITVSLVAMIPGLRDWIKRRNLSAYERRWARQKARNPSG